MIDYIYVQLYIDIYCTAILFDDCSVFSRHTNREPAVLECVSMEHRCILLYYHIQLDSSQLYQTAQPHQKTSPLPSHH